MKTLSGNEQSAVEIPLVDAAHQLCERYGATLNKVLVGELRGRKVNGRWWVDTASLERLKARLAVTPASAA
jgi:hypothetical protein